MRRDVRSPIESDQSLSPTPQTVSHTGQDLGDELCEIINFLSFL